MNTPDLIVFVHCHGKNKEFYRVLDPDNATLKLIFDGKTGDLKIAEVLK